MGVIEYILLNINNSNTTKEEGKKKSNPFGVENLTAVVRDKTLAWYFKG